jgi:hypothetical protein
MPAITTHLAPRPRGSSTRESGVEFFDIGHNSRAGIRHRRSERQPLKLVRQSAACGFPNLRRAVVLQLVLDGQSHGPQMVYVATEISSPFASRRDDGTDWRTSVELTNDPVLSGFVSVGPLPSFCSSWTVVAAPLRAQGTNGPEITFHIYALQAGNFEPDVRCGERHLAAGVAGSGQSLDSSSSRRT